MNNLDNHPISELLPAYVIECRNLTKKFHDGGLYADVLSDVNLQVKPAERIAIMGASGSGKSTLLHLLGGLDLPASGQIYVAGKDITLMTDKERSFARNQSLGFIYQFHHLLPEFSVIENVCMPLLLRNISPKPAKEKSAYLLGRVGLAKRMQHRLGELSGGERQRTAIARALAADPVCVLADEPTGNLDCHTADGVYALMLELNESLGTSFVVATHDIKLAQKMERILVLENGVLHERKI